MMTVRDVMTKSVISVRPTTPLREVARLLAEERVSGLPVVDEAGVVVGVVSEADFLVKEQGAGSIRHRWLAGIFGDSRESLSQLVKLRAATAAEAMTAPAVTIGPNRPIHEAAAIMTARGVNRLPVVEGVRLVGIVTRADLVRAYVRSDDELAETIREDVLYRILCLDPARFTVAVRDGIVSMGGSVERRSTAELAERAVAMVPGIVRLDANVAWIVDDTQPEPGAEWAVPLGTR